MPATESGKPDARPSDVQKPGRGRSAETPSDIPKQGWLDVLSRTKQQVIEDNLSVVAAGVAFYAFVAVVPAIAVMVALYGLIADPVTVADQIASLAKFLPSEVVPLLRDQMTRIVGDQTKAGISAIIGVMIALYSSANAIKALISGLNIAYEEDEKRGFFKLNALALALTLGAIMGVVIAVVLVAGLPVALKFLSISSGVETALTIIRWPLVAGAFGIGLAVVYRFGPSREDAKWRWISPGAIVAGVLWLVGSGLFSLYVAKAGTYDQVYGPLGAVVVFLMWLFISAFVVLIGAELNSELERQTAKDTTEGSPQPMGDRGAHAADTVGPARDQLPPPKKQ